MGKYTRSKSTAKALTAALLAAVATPLTGHAAQGFDLGTNGMTWFQETVIDFSTTPRFGWYTLPSGQKYHYVTLYGQSAGCYEMYTTGTDGANMGGDTYLYAKKRSDATWIALNDDSQRNTDYYSKTRIWLGQGENLAVALAAYSTSYNSMSFTYYLRLLPGISSSGSCDNGTNSIAILSNGSLTIHNRVGY